MIREVRPQVLVTYDQFGGYGHPDHIQAHRVAMYAAMLAAVPSYRRDLGEAWDIDKIYWGAMSETRMREGLRALRAAGDTTSFEGMDPDGPLPFFAIKDEDLSAAVDAQEYVDRKMAALRAHATQITTDGPFFALSNNVGSAAWGIEFYRLVKGEQGPGGRGRPRGRPVRRGRMRFAGAALLVARGRRHRAGDRGCCTRSGGGSCWRPRPPWPRWSRSAAGWLTRLPFALGWVGLVAWVTPQRPEGDYLIGSNTAGYLLLGFALLVLLFAVGTLPRPRRGAPGEVGDDS